MKKIILTIRVIAVLMVIVFVSSCSAAPAAAPAPADEAAAEAAAPSLMEMCEKAVGEAEARNSWLGARVGEPSGYGDGCYLEYDDGNRIWWHPDTGAFAVHNEIFNYWMQGNKPGPDGDFGWPISDTIQIDNGLLSRFERGFVYFYDNPNERGAVYTVVDRSVPNYLFILEKFQQETIRSPDNDTDHVSFVVKVANQPVPEPLVRHTGDINEDDHSDHYVDMSFGPVPIDDPNTAVLFNYQIVNSGHSDSDVEKGIKDAAVKLLDSATYPGVGTVSGWLYDIINADCDGIVAADQVPATRNMIDQWISSSGNNGVYTETREYPGDDSPWGCGDNSMYNVTWKIIRL